MQLADVGDMSQTFCGSKAYAAPEILQGRTYDPMKADVWALGVIMYIFITGKMPFDETKVCVSDFRGTSNSTGHVMKLSKYIFKIR